MIIDDDLVDRMVCKRLLNSQHLAEELVFFSDAEAALQSMETEGEQHADVILLDINMPRMNGLEFLEALQSSNKIQFSGRIAVMMSVNLTSKMRAAIEQMPAVSGFLAKPLTTVDLLASGVMAGAAK